MEVEYEVTAEDLIAFQRHLKKHRSKPQQNSLVASIIWIVVFLGALASYYFFGSLHDPLANYLASLLPGVGVGALMTLVVITLHAKLMALTAPNAIHKVLQEGRNAEKSLGWRRVVIDAQGVHITSETHSIIYLWRGIDKVAATDKYVFLYFTTVGAFIVPVRAFADVRAFDAFVDTARRYHGMAGVRDAVREVIGERGGRERAGPPGVQAPANPDDSGAADGILAKRRLPSGTEPRP